MTKFSKDICLKFTNIDTLILIRKSKRKFIIINIYFNYIILELQSYPFLQLLKNLFIKKFLIKNLNNIKRIIIL